MERPKRSPKDLQNSIATKITLDLDDEEIAYTQTPVGKSQLDKKQRDDVKKVNPRIQCDTCGKSYTKNNGTAHKRTKHHQTYEILNRKMTKLLLGGTPAESVAKADKNYEKAWESKKPKKAVVIPEEPSSDDS